MSTFNDLPAHQRRELIISLATESVKLQSYQRDAIRWLLFDGNTAPVARDHHQTFPVPRLAGASIIRGRQGTLTVDDIVTYQMDPQEHRITAVAVSGTRQQRRAAARKARKNRK